MAIDRFSNIEEINETDGKVRGVVWNKEDIDALQLDIKHVTPEERPIVEIHLYTVGASNNYVAGGVIESYEFINDKLYINYGEACKELGIERGQFEVVINIYKNLLGSDEELGLFIKEISADRRELHIKGLPNADVDVDTYLRSFGNGTYKETTYQKDDNGELVRDENGDPIPESITERPLSDDIALNFGDNRIYKVINQKDWEEENDFVVRLYTPLEDEIAVKTKLWTIEQLSDSYVDNITLSGPSATELESKKLLGPNFNLDINTGTVTETDFKNWNQLLDANTATSQQIVDRIFSGSFGDAVNIDYSGLQNFIHFSSATERLANFRYKLQLIEYYDSRIQSLTRATGTDSDALQGNIATNQGRREHVIGSFDGFERYLYYDPTASIFTHHDHVYNDNDNLSGVYRADGGYIGAYPYRLSPFPKYLSGSQYYLYHTTSSIAEDWYNGFASTASLYDEHNHKALRKTIPEHIRLDSNNDQFEIFVNMIGQHFDILYSHIENLTRVYKPEEHPKLGQSKETLFEVAKSLGWTLQNGNQAEALWKYKLGVNPSGSYQTTSSMFSKSNEEITTEVWRRIVNNLPYLLKTKGTARSIKALMNTYGIPQTLLSIREYGGPKVAEDQPTLIEDRYSYALNFNSGSSLRFVRGWYSASIDNWGTTNNPTYESSNLGGYSDLERPPDTIAFRFKPAITESMIMLSHEGGTNNVHWNLGIEHTGSYSGSGKYGRVFFQMRTLSGGPDVIGAGSTYHQVSEKWVPIYDGEFWNVRLWTDFPFITASHTTPTVPRIRFQAQKASDYITGKIVHRTSGSLHPGSGSNNANAANIVKYWANQTENKKLYLGGNSGSGLFTPYAKGTFTGSIQEYREFMEVLDQETFDLHTLNPTSYVSSISPTSSFDTLVRHYPLGTDLNAVDRTVYTVITSSHPNSTITDFSPPYPDGVNSYATASGFVSPLNAQRGNYLPVEETYYIQGVSLGGNVPRSQKIRLEDNHLVRRLSPKTSGEKSRFDRAPIDTNRLGLFYSHADQINKDIFNHIGDVELDNYVGDPDDEFKFEYPDLTHFSKEYWKKYSDKNDVNAYIKIFSQFDFSLFEQIKQLLPERVDEAMGVLVEPHALERVKVKLHERPIREPLHYEGNVPDLSATASGLIIPLSGSIDRPISIQASSSGIHKGDYGYVDAGNYVAYFSGSQGGLPGGDPYDGTVYKHIYTIFPYQQDSASASGLGLGSEITGTLHPLTTSPTGSIILRQRPSKIFKLDKLHYSGSSTLSKRLRNAAGVISESKGNGVNSKWNYSRSLDETSYMDDFFQMTENQRYEGCRLTAPAINASSTINAIDQKPVIEIFETNPNTLIFNNEPDATNPGNLDVR